MVCWGSVSPLSMLLYSAMTLHNSTMAPALINWIGVRDEKSLFRHTIVNVRFLRSAICAKHQDNWSSGFIGSERVTTDSFMAPRFSWLPPNPTNSRNSSKSISPLSSKSILASTALSRTQRMKEWLRYETFCVLLHTNPQPLTLKKRPNRTFDSALSMPPYWLFKNTINSWLHGWIRCIYAIVA